MLYYLIHITTEENEETKNTYEGNYVASYPDGTAWRVTAIDIQRLINRFTNVCGEDCCIKFSYAKIDEEQYNLYKKIYKEINKVGEESIDNILERVFEILRECKYEFDECESADACIENLIQDILDNIE
jgi:hypothetical protein